MLKHLHYSLLLLCPILSQAQFAPESDPHRGMYVDGFLKMNPNNTAVDTAQSILSVDFNHDGIFEKEDELLSYACENHITYLTLYDTHRIIAKHRMVWNENSKQYEDLEKHLCRFIQKAKSEYGVTQIGAIGGSANYFDSLGTFMDRYPLTAPIHLDSSITSSPYFDSHLRIAEQEFHVQSPEARKAELIKQKLDILNFNASNTCGVSIDVINVEYEFWGDCANEFQNFYDISVSMNSLKQIYNSAHPNHPLITEAYLAFLFWCGGTPNANEVAETIDGCSNCAPFPGTTNPHPAMIDRVLLSFLQPTPLGFSWGEQSLFENAATSDSTDLHPIFYAESKALGGSFDYMGTWFPQAPTNTIFFAENYYFYHFLNLSGSYLGQHRQNDVQAGGVHWFAYTFMKDNLKHPQIMQSGGAYCSAGAITPINLTYYGPAEPGTDFEFYITDNSNSAIVYPTSGIPHSGTSISTIPNPAYGSINFHDTLVFPAIRLPNGDYTAHLNLHYNHSSGCSYSTTCPVIVDDQPRIILTGDSAFCAGGFTFLQATQGGSYAWYRNGKLMSGQNAATLKVTQDGDYYCTTWGSCTGNSNSIHVTVHPMPEVTISSYCNGNNTVTLRADLQPFTTSSTLTNGPSGMTYLWETGATTAQIVVAVPSSTETYHLNVYDPYSGCSVARSFRVPPSPDSLTAHVYVVTTPSSPCSSDGALGAELLPTSSVIGDCNYLWSNGANTQTVYGLPPGNYTVTISMLKTACSSQGSITLGTLPSNSPTLTSTITNAGCTNSHDGAIALSISGGNPPFSYYWEGIPNENGYDPTQLSQSNLFAGIYTLHVYDVNGCHYSFTYTVSPTGVKPSGTVVSVTAVTGCSYNTNGVATVSAAGGSSPYTYSWSDPLSQTGATASNLQSGTYDVVITDAHGCTNSIQVHVMSTIAALQTYVLPISTTELICPDGSDGSLYVYLSGGTEPYSVNAPWQLTNDTAFLDNLTDSTYQLTLTDNNSCNVTSNFHIQNNNFDFSSTDSSTTCIGCPNGSIQVSIANGLAPFSITINPNAGTIQGNSITDLLAGEYLVCVTDANNCTVCHTDTVFNDPLSVPDALTENTYVYPNPSHGNFMISASYLMENDAFIRIFDTQGKLIYERNNLRKSLVEIQTLNFRQGMYFLESGTDNFARFRTRLILFN